MKKQEKSKKTFVILDAHALIHRAFHALPPLTSPKGEPVGAVYGVASVFLKILREFEPDYVAAAFDLPEPTFRHEAYAEYKAQRGEAAPDLIPQFNKVREMFDAFHVASYAFPGFEADDVLGTLVLEIIKKKKDVRIVIASGDLDAVQLVEGDRVVVYTLKKGVQDTITYNEKTVRERFGFAPKLLPDYKGLKGDPSDNIKGVPGIGEKTALLLVQKFGSLENVYKNLAAIKKDASFRGRVAEILQEHKEAAFMSRELTRIRCDVPIPFDIKDAARSRFDWEGAASFLRILGFTSLLARIPQGLVPEKEIAETPREDSVPERVQAMPTGRQVVNSATQRAFFKEAENSIEIGWLLDEGNDALRILLPQSIWELSGAEAAASANAVNALFQKKKIRHVSFQAKPLFKWFWQKGITPRIGHDAAIAAWVLAPTLRSPEFQALMKKRGVSTLLALAKKLDEELEQKGLGRVFREIEMPLIPVLARMEEAGVLVDSAVLKNLSRKLTERLQRREARIYRLAGTSFNINSPRQLGEVLFSRLALATDTIRKTEKGGEHSTRASELFKLREAHPIIDEILQYREEAKLKSTYVDTLPLLVNKKTGRIHTTFNQTGTATGRLSSENPNLQNIPIRAPLGKEVRRAFVARDGYEFIAFDYSQMELRIAASLAGDETMIQAFTEGEDIHTRTAAEVYGVLPHAVTPAMRRMAKAINFGIMYGMGAESLAESTGSSRKEAEAFIRAYFEHFQGIKRYAAETRARVERDGFVETFFGRKRFFEGFSSLGWRARREAERMALNAPIQGTEADIIKRAMIRIAEDEKEYIAQGKLALLVQVHDELVFEAEKSITNEAIPRIARVMEHVCSLRVPLVVDITRGENWYQLTR